MCQQVRVRFSLRGVCVVAAMRRVQDSHAQIGGKNLSRSTELRAEFSFRVCDRRLIFRRRVVQFLRRAIHRLRLIAQKTDRTSRGRAARAEFLQQLGLGRRAFTGGGQRFQLRHDRHGDFVSLQRLWQSAAAASLQPWELR